MISQILNSWMNRSGIRKLRKRIFKYHVVEDVSATPLIEMIETSRGASPDIVTFLTYDGDQRFAVLEVNAARKLEHLLYVKQRAHRETFFRNFT